MERWKLDVKPSVTWPSTWHPQSYSTTGFSVGQINFVSFHLPWLPSNTLWKVEFVANDICLCLAKLFIRLKCKLVTAINTDFISGDQVALQGTQSSEKTQLDRDRPYSTEAQTSSIRYQFCWPQHRTTAPVWSVWMLKFCKHSWHFLGRPSENSIYCDRMPLKTILKGHCVRLFSSTLLTCMVGSLTQSARVVRCQVDSTRSMLEIIRSIRCGYINLFLIIPNALR